MAIPETVKITTVGPVCAPEDHPETSVLIGTASGLLVDDQAEHATAPAAPSRLKRVSRSTMRPPADASHAQAEAADQTESNTDQEVSLGADWPVAQALPGATGETITIDDFDEVFNRFQTPLMNYVFRLVGNREQAADLTQDALIKAYRALASGTVLQAGALSTWLYRIAHNTATDALRRRRLISWVPMSQLNPDYGFGTHDQLPTRTAVHMSPNGIIGSNPTVRKAQFSSEDSDRNFERRIADRELIETVLKRLPPKYAHCLLLYEYQGLSCAEVAEVLSISPSAVKMRLMRARERFIQIFGEETNRDDIRFQQADAAGRLARAESRRTSKQRDQQSGSIPIRKGPNVDQVVSIRPKASAKTATDRVNTTRQVLQQLWAENVPMVDGATPPSRPISKRPTAPRGGKLKKPATQVLSAAQ